MDKNRELHELLGLCWHAEAAEWEDARPTCLCGMTFLHEQYLENHIINANPDYTTDAGKVQLLREMVKRDDFTRFLGSIRIDLNYDDVPYIEILYIIDTTGKLRDMAIEWLKKVAA